MSISPVDSPMRRVAGVGRKRHHEWAAFTLIELLVVTAILGIVVAAVGACLAGGIRVWDVARRFNRHEADAMMGFQMMRRDIARLVPFEVAPFEGAKSGLQFTGINVVPAADGRDASMPRLTRTRYYHDAAKRAWCRAVAPLDWAGTTPPAESVEIMVANVDRAALRYAPAPEDGAPGLGPGWSGTWTNPTNLPAVVEVELTVQGAATTQWLLVPLAGEEGV